MLGTIEPGYWERGVCWIDPSGGMCVNARTGRYNVENTELQHQQDLAEQTLIAALAQSGATDAVRQAMFNQVMTIAMVLVPAVVLVGGGVGGYLWWRRGQREEDMLEAEIEARSV